MFFVDVHEFGYTTKLKINNSWNWVDVGFQSDNIYDPVNKYYLQVDK
jgi:hypothetical protein